MRRRVKYFILAISLCICMLSGNDAKAEEYQKGPVKMKISYGIDSCIMQDDYVPVRISISTEGTGFEGEAELSYTQESADMVHLRKKIKVLPDQTVVHTFLPLWNINPVEFEIKISDENDKVVFQKKKKAQSLVKGNKVAIGVLSKDTEQFAYLAQNKDYVLNLTSDDITGNAKALSMLDMIVIQDYSLDGLKEEQLQILKEWIQSGKTLVIGKGKQNNEAIKQIDRLLPGATIGQEQQVYSNLENESVKQKSRTIIPVQVEKATSIINEKKVNLLQSVEMGNGNIIISSFNLGVSGKEGKYILKVLENNLSDHAKFNFYVERTMDVFYDQRHVNQYLSTSGNTIPKTSMYIPFFIVYLLLVGPILYLVLKKYDKREYMWFLVPACSVAFTVIIYIVGYHSRIKVPQLTYINYVTVAGDKAEEKLNFNILIPFNNNYKIPFQDGYNLTRIADQSHYSNTFTTEANTSLNISDKSYMLLNEYPALSATSFQAEYQSTLAGGLETDITQRSTQYSGSIENKMGFDLQDCILILNDQLYEIGSLKNKQKISINNVDMINYINKAGEIDHVIKKISKDAPMRQQIAINMLYDEYINMYTNTPYGRCFLIGIMDKENELVKSTGVQSDGINLAYIPVKVAQQGGEK